MNDYNKQQQQIWYFQSSTLEYSKHLVFNKNTRHVKKQSMVYTQEKRNQEKLCLRKPRDWIFVLDNDFKWAIISLLSELKKTMSKELKRITEWCFRQKKE